MDTINISVLLLYVIIIVIIDIKNIKRGKVNAP